MTKEQYHLLENDAVYEFRFYYGVVRVGILAEDMATGRICFIAPPDISQLQEGRSPAEIGETINLETIATYRKVAPGERIDPPRSPHFN